MKKIFFLVFLLSALISKAQYPITITSGNTSTLQKSWGSYGGNLGYVFTGSFGDTTAANLSFIKNVPGQLIRVGDTLWMRNSATTKWLKQGGLPTGGSNSTLQQVFDTEVGGSVLSKSDTVLMGSRNVRFHTTDGFNNSLYVYENDSNFTTIKKSRIGLWASGRQFPDVHFYGPAKAGVTMSEKMGIGYDHSDPGNGLTFGHNYIDFRDSSDFLIERNAAAMALFRYDGLTQLGILGSVVFLKSGGTLSDNGRLLQNYGSTWLADTLFYRKSLVSASTSDSVLVKNSDGAILLRAQSDLAVTGSTPTLQQVITAGSTLTSANTITGGAFTQRLNTSGSSYGWYVQNTNAGGIRAEGNSNVGLWAYSNTTTGALVETYKTTTNDVVDVLSLRRWTDGGNGATGLGASLAYSLETSSGAMQRVGGITSKWINTTTPLTDYDITGTDATEKTYMNIQTGGIVRVNDNADTLATRAYARSVGGGGGSLPSLAQNHIYVGDATSAPVDAGTGLTFNGTTTTFAGNNTAFGPSAIVISGIADQQNAIDMSDFTIGKVASGGTWVQDIVNKNFVLEHRGTGTFILSTDGSTNIDMTAGGYVDITNGKLQFSGTDPATYSTGGRKMMVMNSTTKHVELETVPTGGTGDMLASNNLSDLTNTATARTNLGVSLHNVTGVGNSTTNQIQTAGYSWTDGTNQRGALGTTTIVGTTVGLINLQYGATNTLGIRPASLSTGRTAIFPDADVTVLGEANTATVTNKTYNAPIIGTSGTAGSAQIKTVGSVPTVSQTGAGSGGSVGVAVETGSTDHAGTITITTGNASVGSTGTVTLTFNQAYTGNNPVIVLTLVNGATAWGALATAKVSTQSLSAPVITWTNSATGAAVALTANTTYKISYMVVGK